MENNVNEGTNEGMIPAEPQVKLETQETTVEPENDTMVETVEGKEEASIETETVESVSSESNIIPEKEVFSDPDEALLAEFLEKGQHEVTINDLVTAGFDPQRIKTHTFQVGKFKVSRLLLVEPFKIERLT